MNSIAHIVNSVPVAMPTVKRGRPFTLTQHQYDWMAYLIREGCHSQREIAESVGVTRSQVNNLARRLAAGGDVPQVLERPYKERHVDVVRNTVASGITVPQVARMLGISVSAAQCIVRHRLNSGAGRLRDTTS